MIVDATEVHGALERNEVVPAFQPIVDLRDGSLLGFEVLARWQHSELGPILPQNFIAVAEQSGLIGRLSEQVMTQSFRFAATLPTPLVLAVNISPHQLHDPTLPNQILAIADGSGFVLEQLSIEITESALVVDLESARKNVLKLKAMGCRMALDDFGTGYSSLLHLQALPFDLLKVDRSFVSSMTTNRDSRKIVAAVVGLGHSLGLTTVGEGVETAEQERMLLALGCGRGQGWLFGKPMLQDKIAELVAAGPRMSATRLAMERQAPFESMLEALPHQRLAQLKAIYDGAPVGLCFLDTGLRYVSINQRLGDMNGASVSAHLGRRVEEMLPEFYPIVEPYLLRALAGEAMHEVELPRPPERAGEPNRTILASYQPARDEADEVIGISIAVFDITERKRAEATLRIGGKRQDTATGLLLN